MEQQETPSVVHPEPREALEDFEFSADKGPYAATRLPYGEIERGRIEDLPRHPVFDRFRKTKP